MNAPELLARHRVFVKKLQDSQDERVCVGTVDGLEIKTEPYHTDRKHERSRLIVNGEFFGYEWTFIPWNPFQEISTRYWLLVDLAAKSEAERLLSESGADGVVESDPYADPERFHIWVSTLEDVAKVFKKAKHHEHARH